MQNGYNISNISEVFSIFAGRTYSRILKSVIIIEINNSRILDSAKSQKITNSRKSTHAKMTRSTVESLTFIEECVYWL